MRYSLLLCLTTALALSGDLARAQDGDALYRSYGASCHDAGGEAAAPARDVLQRMTPEQILQSLERGAMRRQAAERSRVQRRALAEYLSGRPLSAETAVKMPPSAFCSASAIKPDTHTSSNSWNGWGQSLTNARSQTAAAAALAEADVPRLTLKWAFGFPGAASASSQPVIVGHRLYVSSPEGDVYALDPQTGCIFWTFEADAGVRSAASVGELQDGRAAVFFGDQSANMYGLDAETGKLLWKTQVDAHSRAAITGSPTLYDGRLFVPVSSREESQLGDRTYACCRFRGSVVALNARTGGQIWKTYTIPDEARPTVKNSVGTQLWGPSGAAVWNAPTIDVQRNVLYVGTGNNYSSPSTRMSDAVLALDIASGAIKWARQITENDIWNVDCLRPERRDPVVCPDPDAPDFDFPASPILVRLASGKTMLVATNKSGFIFALDPDDKGKTVWQRRVAKGGLQGGVMWGTAVDGLTMYAPLSDFDFDRAKTAGGGLSAVNLTDGRVLWTAPPASCAGRTPCSPAQAAAATAIPGVVFSGTVDGRLRAYSMADGRVIWEFDTVREYSTVNGVPAKGGSISNGGPAVVDGMLFTNSGYSHHAGILPGNVLLAFGVER